MLFKSLLYIIKNNFFLESISLEKTKQRHFMILEIGKAVSKTFLRRRES